MTYPTLQADGTVARRPAPGWFRELCAATGVPPSIDFDGGWRERQVGEALGGEFSERDGCRFLALPAGCGDVLARYPAGRDTVAMVLVPAMLWSLPNVIALLRGAAWRGDPGPVPKPGFRGPVRREECPV